MASSAKRVRALTGDRVRIERGSPLVTVLPRVAVIAHWSLSHIVTKSVCVLVHELQSFGYRVVVSSACEADDELVWNEGVEVDDLVIIRKPNLGYDFGSWSVALSLMPEIARAERVIIANDSMAGPFVSLRPLLEQLENTAVDVWGLTDSEQFRSHLQSYFLGFCGGVLADKPLTQFWADTCHDTEKSQIIYRNEIGLSLLLSEEGYVRAPAFPNESFVTPGQNPVIVGWRRLLEQGFPFLKREIVRDPAVAPNGLAAPAFIREFFEADVSEWIDDKPRESELNEKIDDYPREDEVAQHLRIGTAFVHRPLVWLRQKVRLRTRWRAWRSSVIEVHTPRIDGWPADFTAWVQREPGRQRGGFPDAWRGEEDIPVAEPANVGVVLHVFYMDLLPELFRRLSRIPVAYDLLITNATGSEIQPPDDMGRLRNFRVLDVENRGRDILPLAKLVNAGCLDHYHVILKIHTKRSDWRDRHEALRGDGARWRLDLLDAVLGDEEQIAMILSAFSEQHDLGLVTADESILDHTFWGDNEANVANLLRRIELVLDPTRLRFAAGSIYWVRGFVLQGLRALNLDEDDFEAEEGQVNLTTAHAVERAMGVLIEEAGLSLVGSATLKTPSNHSSFRRLDGDLFQPRARIVPFYLPQFHPIPENDRWWGEGFTEWTNVTAARPVFEGHYQPRLPRDLGFYDLRFDDARRGQLSLASASGIAGFMYYYYWFGGKRLLDAPIEALVKSDIAQPFCIMWANENWTRRWDGRESDVLIAQDYDRIPSDHFIDDIMPFLADERYMEINGKKIVAVYRPGQIPDLAAVIASWRTRARATDVGELFIMNVDTGRDFHGVDGTPAEYGFDGSLGFPPHNHPWQVVDHTGLRVNSHFRGNILSYAALANAGEQRMRSGLGETFFPGVMVAFDNTPRRQWAPDIWFGANPYTFRRWLASAVDAVLDRPHAERMVFVNAWNEWAEGASLEPTHRVGRTFLLAVRDVILA